MAKKPTTLPEALAEIDRLQNVVDRTAERVNELEDVVFPRLKADVDEANDTIAHLMARTDETGADALKAAKLVSVPARSDLPRVERVRKGNRTVARLVYSR